MKTIGIVALAAGLLAAAVPAPAADESKASDGFVQLFNGKDLTGWKTHPDDKAKWEVVDGAIVGGGAVGHLYTERGDYENFVFRIEAKVNDHGNSGQYVRAKFTKGFPPGYEAQINATHGDRIKTGSLYPAFLKDRKEQKEFTEKYCVLNKPPAGAGPDEWFTQEVTADGNHITIKVNGTVTVDYTDPHNTYTKGHLAFQAHDPRSKVWVRKAEVKELPSKK
ncbi:MAG TPA: DUF1080 domain-containing protein [Gemmataceae bacterium]|jgi:hypothetical protein